MRRIVFLIILAALTSGVCYAQGFDLEYEYPADSYLSFDYSLQDLGDLDGDGFAEIVISDVSGWPDSGTIVVLDNNYTEIWSYTRSGLEGDLSCKGFADMDGDGDRELLVGHYVSGSMYATDVVDYPSGSIMATLTHESGTEIFDFDNDGKSEIAVSSSGCLQIWGLDSATGLEVPDIPLTGGALDQNSPNPFNPRTVIKYHVQSAAKVELDIVDLGGRLVRTLVSDSQPAGDYEVAWDGVDDGGRMQASGTYLYVLHVGDYSTSRKLMLMK